MTLHIFSASSHNKYSLFCTCLDGGRGEQWGWRGGAGWGRGGGGGWNRHSIQRTDQRDRSLKQTLSPSSEWQLVRPQRLAQPSPPPLPPPSFSLICYSYVLSRLLFHSPLLFYYSPISSLLPLCAHSTVGWPSSASPLTLSLFFFLRSNTPLQPSQ